MNFFFQSEISLLFSASNV